MDVSDSHTYAAPLDAVLDMFADPDAVVARYEGMGHRDVQVLECARSADSLTVRTSRVVDVDLPGFARKVLSPTNTMEQTDRWTAAADGTWDGTVAVEVQGAPVKMSGTMRLEPAGEQTTMHLTLSMNVKVPLVGGKIADWAGKNDVPRTIAAEFAAGDAWLADHPG
jgi:hypothetical protein